MPSINLLPDNTRVDVGTIYGIGRNYVRHIEELNNEMPDEPVLFLKPAASLITQTRQIELPAFSTDIHHEVEVVLLVGREGRNISKEDALRHVTGVGVGLDLTARDTQSTLREKGLPWTTSKGFETAACVSDFLPIQRFRDLGKLHFRLRVNGELRQEGDSSLMIFPVPAIIAHISSIITLQPGDLIFTGTPHGVARITPGDQLDLSLEDILRARFTVAGS